MCICDSFSHGSTNQFCTCDKYTFLVTLRKCLAVFCVPGLRIEARMTRATDTIQWSSQAQAQAQKSKMRRKEIDGILSHLAFDD